MHWVDCVLLPVALTYRAWFMYIPQYCYLLPSCFVIRYAFSLTKFTFKLTKI